MRVHKYNTIRMSALDAKEGTRCRRVCANRGGRGQGAAGGHALTTDGRGGGGGQQG